MKKILLCLGVMLLVIHPKSVLGEDLILTPNASASILIEAESRQIIYEYHSEDKLYPASTTKIMTMILLFEAIRNQQLSFEDMVTTSAYAASMGGSQIYLEEGEQLSVHDMFKAIAIASANDACVAIGEKIAGTNDRFVSMMNDKAKELGLVNTHFVNCTGLHDDDHYTCAKDLATMASYLIDIGNDDLFAVTSLYDAYIREDQPQKFWLVNTNKLLKQYEGNDGLKTGFTKQAGYCLVSTAKRHGLRLIGVVMNESLPKVRNSEMMQLLDYGFNLYECQILFKKEEEVTTFDIYNSKIEQAKAVAKEDISFIQNKTEKEDVTYDVVITQHLAPILPGDVVGKVHVYSPTQDYGEFELTVLEAIEPLTLVEYWSHCFEQMLSH